MGLKKSSHIENFKVVFQTSIFGNKTNVSSETNIAIKSVNKATGISFSGIDLQDNKIVSDQIAEYELDMSYMGKATKEDLKTFDATLHFGEGQGLRYNELVYSLYEVDQYGNVDYSDEVTDSNIIISENNGHFVVRAKDVGGRYLLVVKSKDSYNGTNFDTTKAVVIRIDDGSEEFKYLVSSPTEFDYIRNGLDAYYELGANINLGKITEVYGHSNNANATALTGGIDGNGWTLTYKIESAKAQINEGNVVSLFAILGTTEKAAKINDLNINATIKVSSAPAEDKDLIIAGFAGLAQNAEINNVGMVINSDSNVTANITTSDNIYFGGMVGINNANIFNSSIEYKSEMPVDISAKTNAYIGAMVATNSGTIIGSYAGKEDLDTIAPDVRTWISVSCAGHEYLIGGIAGDNSGTISNMMVSGKISANKETGVTPKGHLGGVAGNTSGNISTIAVLALDLESDCLDIAGAVGSASAVILHDVKVINVEFEYALNTYFTGAITGYNIVAGLVASGNNTTITNSSVENFVQKNDYYTLVGNEVGAEVYGLMKGTGTVSNSFVIADLDTKGSIDITTNATETDTYFVGSVNGATSSNTTGTYAVIGEVLYYSGNTPLLLNISDNKKLNTIMTLVDKTKDPEEYDYIYILENGKYKLVEIEEFDNKIYYTLNDDHEMLDLYIESGASTYLPLNTLREMNEDLDIYTLLISTDEWSTKWSSIVNNNTENFNISTKLNCVKVGSYSVYLPYLVDSDGDPLMIIAPTDIDAVINQEEIKDIHSVYVDNYVNNGSISGVSIDEMAIVNYYDGAKEEDNTYNLRDLIDLTIFPELAQGGIRFEIIGAITLPARINGDFITFYGITGNSPIIVRCYSLFSPDLEKYIAFYSDYGVSELQINSTDRVNKVVGGDVDYAMTLYTGDIAQLLSVDAENILDGNEYKTIFDSFDVINSGSLYLDVNSNKNATDTRLDIVKSGFDIELSVKDMAFDDGHYEIITIKLMLDQGYYTYSEADIEIATIKLKVSLTKSATDIIVDSDHYEVFTNGNLNVGANLHTGFVSTTNINNTETLTLNEDNQYTFAQSDRDSILLGISQVGGSNTAFDTMLENIAKYHGETIAKDEVIKLFDVVVHTKDLDGKVGYRYDINLELKNKFYYRYITEDIEFEISIVAYSDRDINKTVSFTLKPAMLSTKRIENYSVKTFDPYSQYQNIVTNEYVESSTIEPGGIGSIMMLYLEPEYANVKEISITSDSKPIASLGGANVYLKYTQYIYDADKGMYLSYFGADKNYQEGTTLKINKASERRNGQIIYTGVIYLHVMLDRFSGVETFTSTVNLTLGDGSTTSIPKTLLTSYIPTVITEYEGITLKNGYMIQEGTANTLNFKIYGYQFNSNPDINLGWYLPDGSDYWYSEVTTFTTEEDFNKTNEKWYQKADGKYYRATEYVAGTTYYIVESYNAIYPLSNTEDVKYVGNYVHTYLKNDYKEIKHDLTDDSYSIGVGFNVVKNLPAAFSIGGSLYLITKDGQLRTSESEALIFYPADYILVDDNPIALLDSPNTIAIGANKEFELGFKTLYSQEWKTDLFERLLTEYGADELLTKFEFVYEGEVLNFTNEQFIQMIYNENAKKYIIRGISPLDTDVTLQLTAYYILSDDGIVRLSFKLENGEESSIDSSIVLTFALNVYAATSEDEPLPIYSASDMFNSDGSSALAESAHYILMSDIDLTSITDGIIPISTAIASLDGNNKIIKIGKFKTDETTNYGLFSEIGTYAVKDEQGNTTSDNGKTTLKNVIVDYSAFEGLSVASLENNNIFFGGLVGQNKGGLIYNCDVINREIGKKVVNLTAKADQNITFGGLVAQNNGIITNSRVGRESYEKITPTLAGTGITVSFGTLEFVIGDDKNNAFNALVGGFVGENTGEISSSFVSRTNVVNYSMAEDNVQNDGTTSGTNKTAGFVAKNSKNISFSYVRGTVSTGTYYTGAKIQHIGNGAVAGFVHENSGNVDNCFANITLMSSSAPLAGFVYNNNTSGIISKSYAACEFNDGNEITAFEQPFVGKTSQDKILSNGKLINTYYYIKDNKYSNIENPENKPVATGLNKSNFENSASLIGFDFVLSNTVSERSQGIWSYYTLNGEYRSLPELVMASNIAHSCRYQSGESVEDDGKKKYTYSYVAEFSAGNKNNPYIIRDLDDYNNVFINESSLVGDNKVFTGYVRFINDIEFNDTNAVPTRSNFVLGSNTATTSIEGNGVTISGILIEADSANGTIESMGLFSEIDNVYLKNLNLKFTSNSDITSTTNCLHTGGLAGKINDSVIINVSLDGNDVTLSGFNFVGGVAGKITGKSIIYSVESNLNVLVGKRDSKAIYGDPNHIYLDTEYSYGGGLAGVIDLESRAGQQNNSFNLAYITINGSQMPEKDNGNILADFAGGIAGYANENVVALKLKYYNGENDKIIGIRAVGGLFGVFAGSMTASQVTMIEGESLEEENNNQYKIDTAFAKYILDLEKATNDGTAVPTLDLSDKGNVSLLESHGYAGGLVGFGVNAKINSSYSKAGISRGKHVGGIAGGEIASTIAYSYAVPFINLSNEMKDVGGMIGRSYADVESTDTDVNTYCDMAKRIMYNATDMRAKLEFTFSTIMIDTEATLNENVKIDYYANYEAQPTFNRYVFVGEATGYNSKITKNIGKITSLPDLCRLNDSVHETTFDDIFSGWNSIPYWSLDSNRYYPLLLNETVLNLTIIEDHNDLLNITADGHYKIVKDIDLSSINFDDNWVIDHLNEFRGTLTGEKEDKSVPMIYGMSLVDTDNASTGFFKKTVGASISNLKFVWGKAGDTSAINTNGKNITFMSGLSCEDVGSLFTNVQVSVASNSLVAELTSDSPDKVNNQVQGFGGLIGKATNSNIKNCSFSGGVNIILEKDGDENSYFGGLVGKAEHIEDPEGLSYEDSMAISGSHVGENIDFKIHPSDPTQPPKTAFNIAVNQDTTSYIGGMIGYISGGASSMTNVGNDSYSTDYRYVTIDVDYSKVMDNSQYFGGIAGYAGDTTINEASTSVRSSIELGKSNYIIGGLVGENSLDSITPTNGIRRSVAGTDISISSDVNTTADSVNIGGLVGIGTTIAIKQSLADGSIDMSNASVSSTYAGGLVGSVTTEADLREVMSNMDMIVSSVSTMHAGGLVGQNNGTTKIMHSTSIGRIVPIVTGEAPIAPIDLAVGGLVGKTTNTLTVNNAYTTSSIVSDSLSTEAVKVLYDGELSNINALVGNDKNHEPKQTSVSMTNVYYASDYSLASESHNYNCTNLPVVGLLTNDQRWADNLNIENGQNVGVWSGMADTIPYISSIYGLMGQKSIIHITDGSYTSGTALNPKRSLDGNEFKVDFTYYLLDAQSYTSVANTLNGILVFKDNTKDNIKKIGDDITDNAFNSLINTVSKHSAISNLHIELYNRITLKDGNNGVLVNKNEGMIYNSSVNGNNITMQTDLVGLVAGSNYGMIMNSFSTAEVVNENNVSGIANSLESGGRIVSSYFTGYLGKGSGIVSTINDTNDTYIYNCYMAGVVENMGHTSMFSQSNIVGSNNFIDDFANIDQVDPANTVVKLVSATNLMMNEYEGDQLLKGQWYTLNDDGGKMIADTNNTHFGYNYGYPVAKMKDLIQDITYQTYTGNGEYDEDLPKLEELTNFASDTDNNVNARYTALISKESDYENAIKIPHLGVLNAVSKLIDDNSTKDGEDKITTAFDKNYIVIYDLDGSYGEGQSKIFKEWTAVKYFTGVFMSSKYYAYSESSEYCTISNLGKKGLFEYISNTYIGDFNLAGKFDNLNNSGTLSDTVVGQTYIDNVSTGSEDIVITGTGNIGGFFGDIKGNINFGKKVSIKAKISGSTGKADTAGLIAGRVLELENESSKFPTITFEAMQGEQYLNATISNATYAGGLVGQIAGGTINGSDRPLYIYSIAGTHNDTLGGFVGLTGKTRESELTTGSVTINNFVLTYICEGVAIPANTFGGYVGVVNYETNILNCKLNVNKELKVASDSTSGFFGMLAGSNIALLHLNKFEMVAEKITFELKNGTISEDSTEQGAGLFIGHQDGGDLLISETMSAITTTIVAKDIVNLGGVVGYYTNGKIVIIGAPTPELKLDGTLNVGGIFGKANAIYSHTFGGEITLQEVGSFTPDKNILEEKWATIELTGGEHNVGGIIGLLSGDIGEEVDVPDAGGPEAVADVGAVATPTSLTELTNNNPILIKISEDGTAQAENIGGIAGKFTGDYIDGKLTNNAEIKYDGTALKKNDDQITAINAQDVDKKNYVRVLNVGGIFGSVGINMANGASEPTAKEEVIVKGTLINETEIQGYQNVGGLIGLIQNTTITGMDLNSISVNGEGSITATNSENTDISDKLESLSTGAVTGVINVGGIVGYAQDSTISKMVSSADVIGNANVGGIVGSLTHSEGKLSTITLNYVKGISTDAVEVRGVYYNYIKNIVAGVETISYIPTNVGGLAGYMNGVATNNVLYFAHVNSANESDGKVISTISNFMLDSENIPTRTIKEFTGSTEIDNNDLIMFNDHIGGFGGFVGHLASNEDHTNNFIYGLDINASLGINVGTYYGYYGSELTNTNNIPTLYGEWDTENTKTKDTLIDGAYNVGGLFGYVANKIVDVSNENIMGEANIKLQTRNIGFYIGGLFGKVDSDNVSNIKIKQTSGISIYISLINSYYSGGLIGRLLIKQGNNVFSGEVDGEIHLYATDIYRGLNHGGLIGLLKVTNTDDGAPINIDGNHTYPFTINTIENQNYYDGDSVFDVQEANGYYLIAQAYYINQDVLNIVGSDLNPVENPIRENNAGGWHKEYTGFRCMQRCIPGGNGAGWDSVAIIFDAYNITKVGTHTVKIGTDTDGNPINQEQILYTIYEESPGVPTLYTPIGFASLLSTTIENNKDYYEIYYKPEDDVDGVSILDFGSALLGVDTTGPSYYYIDATGKTSFNKEGIYTTIDGNSVGYYEHIEGDEVEVVYKIENYLPDDRVDGLELGEITKTGKKTDVYFIFENIYEDSGDPARTGSLFQVNGYNINDNDSRIGSEKSWVQDLAGFMDKYGWILDVGLLVITGGGASAIKTGLKALAKGALKFAKKYFVGLLVVGFLAANLMANQGVGNYTSKNLYGNQRGTSAGMLTSSYTREIFGSNTTAIDNTVIINNIQYTYHSATRPKDYYSAQYIAKDRNGVITPMTKDEYFKYLADNEGVFENENYLDPNNKELGAGTNEIVIYRGYEYYNGAYYAAADAGEVSTSKYSKFIEDENKNEEGIHYISIDGNVYVHGIKEGDNYYIGEKNYGSRPSAYTGNMISSNEDGTKYYVNGKEITSNEVKVAIEGNELTYINTKTTSIEETEKDVAGYTYIQGGYYTAIGRYTEETAFATFKYFGISKPEGVDGIHYIKLNIQLANGVDANGNPKYTSQPIYYTIDSSAHNGKSYNEAKTEFSSRQIESLDELEGDTVNIKLYLHSLSNVYTSTLNGYSGYMAKDNYIYVQHTEGNIKYSPTYFLYEGGYKIEGEKIYVYSETVEKTVDLSIFEGNDNYILENRTGKDSKEVVDIYKFANDIVLKDNFAYSQRLVSTSTEGNYLKYLVYNDKDVQFYSRYKYSINSSIFEKMKNDLSGKWYKQDEDASKYTPTSYELYKWNGDRTYFTESVKVCFGGSNTVYYQLTPEYGARGNTTNSGGINIR
ncbi:MAG: hypothetical protein IKC49_03770 [Clostridia bacterium]|nr:hypothetical protein [Clostridia bacterium]